MVAAALVAPAAGVGLVLAPGNAASASAAPAASARTSTSADPSADASAGDATAAAPSATPSPTDTPAPPSEATPIDPTIDDPGDLTTAIARFRGTGTPGDGVRVANPFAPSGSICTATVSSSGSWSCTGAVTSGPQQVFTVIDTTVSSLHADDAPAADVIVPPTITTSAPTTGGVTGTGSPGATVTVSASGSSAVRTAVVGGDGHWFVSWGSGADALGSGRFAMSASQSASTAAGYRSELTSAASGSVSVTIDRTAPAAPVVSSPTSGAKLRTQPITIAGTGETGAVVTAYIDSNPVCQAVVTSSRWSCTTANESIPDGTRTLAVGQRDPAGNFSPVTAAIRVVVSRAPVDSPPTSSAAAPPSGSAPSSGGSGSAAPPSTPGDTGSASGSGTDAAPSTGAGGTSADGNDGSSGTGGIGVTGGGWSVATTYDSAVPTIQSAVTMRTLLGVLVGIVVFLALVAAPLKLVVRTTRGRVLWQRARFTGRNRSVAERSLGDDTGIPAWATVGMAVALASLLALLGTGIAAEARYARLAIAVVLGTGVLALGVVLATRWAAGTDRHAVTYRISPALVLAALVACVVTRSADLSPAILLGVLVVPTARGNVPTARTGAGAGAALPRTGRALAGCGRSATFRTVALLVLVAVGWVLHSAVAHGGFWGELVGEFAITLCVGGIGSLVTTLLPVAGSAGAALWATSRARYVAIASVGIALAVAVYSGPDGTHVSLLAMSIGVVGCAVVGLVTWMWVRVVEPALR